MPLSSVVCSLDGAQTLKHLLLLQDSWRMWTWSIWAVMTQKCMVTSLMKRFALFTKSGSQNHTPAVKDLILTHLNRWGRQWEEHLQHTVMEQLRANSSDVSPVDYVEKKLKPLVPMYLQALRQWTKMLSLTVSLGHGQPSLCLFCTQLIKAKLVLHIPEQQFAWTAQRPFFYSLAFSG